MSISAKDVKELRDKTGAGMMDCKKALEEAGGDGDTALKLLRTKGMATADKKSGRSANEGLIDSYVHQGGKIGVLLEVNCETDFVARNDEFQGFVHNLAMHIAASAPQWVSRVDVPEAEIERERDVYASQARQTGKPDHVIEKITEGKLDKWLEQVVLLEQPFVKDTDKTIDELRREVISRIGENIEIGRFVRYQLGEEA